MSRVPRRWGPLATVAYLHGTSVSFYDGPSNRNVFGELEERGESFDGPPSSAIFAGAGFIYIAPDYLGLGDSTVPRHRYFHAALALQRALEKRRVEVTATAMVGGVLDVERFFLLGIANTDTVTVPLYIAYLLLAYDDIYDVYRRPADVVRQPYATTVPGLFDMRHFFDDVLAGLPPTSRELLRASFLRAVSGNPDHPLRVRLRQNAVDRWRRHRADAARLRPRQQLGPGHAPGGALFQDPGPDHRGC